MEVVIDRIVLDDQTHRSDATRHSYSVYRILAANIVLDRQVAAGARDPDSVPKAGIVLNESVCDRHTDSSPSVVGTVIRVYHRIFTTYFNPFP